MIHYHGLPINPATAALRAIGGGHAFVSFRHANQLHTAIEVCQSLAVDNGAFSAWKSGEPVRDWRPYYEWVRGLYRFPCFDFAVIPDVIDGDELANDALLAEWKEQGFAEHIGAPVWHMHESLARLERLSKYPRICIGSSAEFARIGSTAWEDRMVEAMRVLCDENGKPVCKIHGLRMLNPKVFTRFPFASADSTNIGRNVGIDSKWKGTYTPPTKEARAAIMRERIESHQSAPIWEPPQEKAKVETPTRILKELFTQNTLFA